MDERDKEIPELCKELREELINFYESRFLPLERDRSRYRNMAKKYKNQIRILEIQISDFKLQNQKMERKVELYKKMYMEKEDNKR